SVRGTSSLMGEPLWCAPYGGFHRTREPLWARWECSLEAQSSQSARTSSPNWSSRLHEAGRSRWGESKLQTAWWRGGPRDARGRTIPSVQRRSPLRRDDSDRGIAEQVPVEKAIRCPVG